MSMPAKYTSNGSILAVIDGQEMTIPNDPSNRHYAELIANGVTIEPVAVPTPEEILTKERTTMACTPMQGTLALGEANWGTILAYRDTAPWQEKVTIDSAQTWVRNSQSISLFQYLLGFTDTQVDDLFHAAILIDA